MANFKVFQGGGGDKPPETGETPEYIQHIPGPEVHFPIEFLPDPSRLNDLVTAFKNLQSYNTVQDSSGKFSYRFTFQRFQGVQNAHALLEKYATWIEEFLATISGVVGGPNRLDNMDKSFTPLQWAVNLPIPSALSDQELQSLIGRVGNIVQSSDISGLSLISHQGMLQIICRADTVKELTNRTKQAIEKLKFPFS